MRRASIFYVWFDAPIGYIGSFAALAAKRGLDFDAYWKAGATTELHHFIGKDISYFHTLFWPAMLQGAGFRRPTGVHVHGFLTVDGQKMSKSRGTNITARRYLDLLPPDHLRYYFAAKLGNGLDDIDFSLDDFTARVNSDIVGKLVNIASRCAPFIERGWRHAGGPAAGPGAVRGVSALPPSPSPRCTSRATTPARCAKSCRWPIAPTSTSTSRSPGCWPRTRRASMTRAALPPRASTCFAS